MSRDLLYPCWRLTAAFAINGSIDLQFTTAMPDLVNLARIGRNSGVDCYSLMLGRSFLLLRDDVMGMRAWRALNRFLPVTGPPAQTSAVMKPPHRRGNRTWAMPPSHVRCYHHQPCLVPGGRARRETVPGFRRKVAAYPQPGRRAWRVISNSYVRPLRSMSSLTRTGATTTACGPFTPIDSTRCRHSIRSPFSWAKVT